MIKKIIVDAHANGEELNHYWNFSVGAGRANEGLRVSWQKQLQMVKEHCGFQYCRFHGLFHDDMFAYQENDGKITYNWQYIDELFDMMLDKGVRPFIELGFMPEDLAANPGTVFWWKGRTAPPNDYKKWADLIKNFVQHLISRYGHKEVRQWYFEVWNEPNLEPFWHGTRSEYFELYKYSAMAVKNVDSSLRVGGPATSNFVPDERFDGETENVENQLTWQEDDIDIFSWKGVWIKEFLEYCCEQQLPVDFVSTHPYPTDFALDGHGECQGKSRYKDSLHDDLIWLKNTIAESAFPDVEIHLTEWSSSPTPRDHSHDNLPAATYVLRANLQCVGLVDSLSYWVFTDCFEESGAGNTIFHGGFGMINLQGIVKPVFHAYRFLNMLGDHRLAQVEWGIITRDSASGKIQGLAFNYPEDITTTVPMCRTREDAKEFFNRGKSEDIEIKINNLTPNAVFNVEYLSKESGLAVAAWEKMGSPEPPNREQTANLQKYAISLSNKKIKADADGILTLKEKLEPWTIMSFREL
jgi:xylan 1,4-beta-xylosidase